MKQIENFLEHPIAKLLMAGNTSQDLDDAQLHINTDLVIKSIEQHVKNGVALNVWDERELGFLQYLTFFDGQELPKLPFNRSKVVEALVRLDPSLLESRRNGEELPIELALKVGDAEMVKTLLPFYKDKISALQITDEFDTTFLDYSLENQAHRMSMFLFQEGFKLHAANIKKILPMLSSGMPDYDYSRDSKTLGMIFGYFTHEELSLAKLQSNNASFKSEVDIFINQQSQSTYNFTQNLQQVGYNENDLNLCWVLCRDQEGKTLLHHAVMLGNEQMADDILKTYAGVRSLLLTDNKMRTPIQLAIETGNVGMVNKFLEYKEGVESLTVKDSNAKTPLYNAIIKGLYGVSLNIMAHEGIRPKDLFKASASSMANSKVVNNRVFTAIAIFGMCTSYSILTSQAFIYTCCQNHLLKSFNSLVSNALISACSGAFIGFTTPLLAHYLNNKMPSKIHSVISSAIIIPFIANFIATRYFDTPCGRA